MAGDGVPCPHVHSQITGLEGQVVDTFSSIYKITLKAKLKFLRIPYLEPRGLATAKQERLTTGLLR